MNRVKRLITIDKEIQFGEPVFKGTRVPVGQFFDYLLSGGVVEEFSIEYPTVSRKQTEEAIAIATKFLTSEKLASLYENLTRRTSHGKPKTKLKRSRRIHR